MPRRIYIVLVFLVLLSACSPQPVGVDLDPAATVAPAAENRQTTDASRTPISILTLLPTLSPAAATATLEPTATVSPTSRPNLGITATPSEADIILAGRANDPVCQSPAKDHWPVLSPDRKWLAIHCESKQAPTDLWVIDWQGDAAWSIQYLEYARGAEYDSDDGLTPFLWSKDGQYLYVVAYARYSGCCWFGNYELLVRLNLETGQQAEIFNTIPERGQLNTVDFSISPSERYVLFVRQVAGSDLAIVDQTDGTRRTIALDDPRAKAGKMVMSPEEDQVILATMEVDENEQWFTSIVLIHLGDGSQTKLLSSPKGSPTAYDGLFPVEWQDTDHVLLSNMLSGRPERQYWLLNVHTAELTEVPAAEAGAD